LDLERLLRVPSIDAEGGFDLSPDGKWAAFAWNPSGQWELYMLPLDGPAPPRQITGGPGGKFSPRFSPNGDRLAYVVDLDGSEAYDLWSCELAENRHANLTPDTPASFQPNLSWSPDGAWLACISDHGGRFDAQVIPAGGGLAQRVLELPYPDWEVRWSPDGSHLAVVSEAGGQDSRLTIVPLQGGGQRPLAALGAALNAREPCWSPDGRRLVFCSDFLHGSFEIGIYELQSESIDWITNGGGEHSTPDWSPDGRRLAFVQSGGPDTWLVVHELEGGKFTRYQVAHGVHTRPRFTPDGRRVAVLFESPSQPCDLWLLSLASGEFRQLTRSLPGSLSWQDFVFPEHVSYPGLDGAPVPALLFKPPGLAARRPAVIDVHGGPDWLHRFAWNPFLQHLAGRGWVVLAPNYRGSSGYGRDWQLASRFDLGGVDCDDLIAGADYLVRQGLADPRRIAVTGRSHGGYLTMTCLTRHPDRWAAGAAVVPFLNWFTSHASSRPDLQHWDVENMGDPEEMHDLWRARSPFFYLDRIQAPVQLICGGNDPRCPPSESIAAERMLRAMGKTVYLALYPDEGHTFLKLENVIDAERRRAAFLAQAFETGGEAER
jgi:dipeptidyl aminopeptidase/acylaminoacyl peptidase